MGAKAVEIQDHAPKAQVLHAPKAPCWSTLERRAGSFRTLPYFPFIRKRPPLTTCGLAEVYTHLKSSARASRMLKGTDQQRMLVLEDEENAERSTTSGDGGDHEKISLTVAFERLREVVRASLPLHEGDDVRAFEWRELRRICEPSGQIAQYQAAAWVGKPSGSEHNCRLLDGDSLFAKVTKVNRAGWRVDFEEMRLEPATPLQYLRRMLMVNFYLGDEVEFTGLEVGPRASDTRIATTQPSLLSNAGELNNPTLDQLQRWIEKFGFTKLDLKKLPHMLGESESIHFQRGDLWLFDVRPHNFVIDGDKCIPIDVIVQHAGDGDINGDFYRGTT